jgi:hypothetical protein
MSQSKISQNPDDSTAPSLPPVNGSLTSANNDTPKAHPVIGSQQAPEELDIRRYRADQNYSLHVSAKKKAIVVPVMRPGRQTWIMVHSDPDWRVPFWLLEDKANQRVYLLEPDIAPDLTGDLVLKLLVAYISLSGAPGLWPIRLPDESGNIDTYNESALAIVSECGGKWIRVLCDRGEKAYSILESPPLDLPAPKWPEGGYDWMVATAFKNRIIKTPEHPVLLALRGSLSK